MKLCKRIFGLSKTVLLLIISVTTILYGCKNSKKLISIDPAFSQYIEAYTSGTVSKKSTIRIQLASDAKTTHTLNEPIDKDLFSFNPSVQGKAYWIDARTIEFRPEKDLEVNKM